jgi:hypothetical protein
MPTLGNALDFAKYEARNIRGHQLGSAPSSPVTGQMYYNTGDNTLYWWDGSAWVSARGGASATPPATTGALGTIQLAGDLAGTATSPQIAAGVITDTDVAAANKDGVAGTASLRTLGLGAQQAMPGNTRIDQIALPTAAVSNNGQKITALADPTVSTDAANKNYVDNTAQGLDAKASVRAATTATITLSGAQTVDGVALIVGDRCLVKDGASGPVNGIYVVAAGAWTRATDMDTWAEVPSAYVWVEQGTVNGDTGWICTSDAGGTIGTTSIDWTQFSGAAMISGGAGLTKTGNTLDVGQGAGITVNVNDVQVATGGVTNAMLAGSIDATTKLTGAVPVANGGTGQTTAKAARETGLVSVGYYSSATHGASATITITQATHGLRASRGIHVQVQDEATGAVEFPDMVVAASGDVTVTYGASVSANSKRVTLVG